MSELNIYKHIVDGSLLLWSKFFLSVQEGIFRNLFCKMDQCQGPVGIAQGCRPPQQLDTASEAGYFYNGQWRVEDFLIL